MIKMHMQTISVRLAVRKKQNSKNMPLFLVNSLHLLERLLGLN